MNSIEALPVCTVANTKDQSADDSGLLELQSLELALVGGGSGDVQF